MIHASVRGSLWVVLGIFVAYVPGAQAGYAHLLLESSPGSYIGGGKNYDITDANAYAIVPPLGYSSLPDGSPTRVYFSVFQTGEINASLEFSTEQLGIALQPGVYTDAQRATFADPGHPGLELIFGSQGSNVLTGNFTITDVQFFRDLKGNYQIASFAATFTQISDRGSSVLNGSFTYNINPFNAVPEPASAALLILGGVIGPLLIRRRGV
ncbi:PEP-CTERM sorting domain-containing protein [Tundrisphaera lichenicola]|uniref:PEP-CTERM sorting domain-containing protein n=1 Tax=Tundrisphaera lichenicola TaxID=2029860 RepID=UPI003EBE4008